MMNGVAAKKGNKNKIFVKTKKVSYRDIQGPA
jgi:hypothetical protein